jgi:hypothetical protein
MVRRSVIQAQLEVLRQNLGRCRKTLKNSDIDTNLIERVANRFHKEFAHLGRECDALETRVATGRSLDAYWRDLGALQHESLKVFDEFLAFIQGALARKAGLDEEICSLTDSLLDDLAHYSEVPWGRFTLLASSEFYLDRAEIIRIRYPEVSLWGMPLVAHEFGHYVGTQLRLKLNDEDTFPFRERLKIADENPQSSRHTQGWYHLQEHFADLFATWTLGPAYAAALIMLRLNPSEARKDTLTHPSAAQRVHSVLWTLDEMDKLQPTPQQRPFQHVAELLRKEWRDSLREAGMPEMLGDAEASLVDQRMAELRDMLVGTTPPELMLGSAGWFRGAAVAARIVNDSSDAALPNGVTRRDVLNAAWLARLDARDQSQFALSHVAARALNEYREIAPRSARR